MSADPSPAVVAAVGSEDAAPEVLRSGRKSRRGAHHRRRRVWPVVVVVVVTFVVAAGVAAGALYLKAEGLPTPLKETTVAAAAVAVPGPLALDWPGRGQAAVSVLGVSGYSSLGTFGAATPVPIASVAKVMTAYVILQDFPLETVSPGFTLTITPLVVQQTAARAALDESVVAVKAGEQIDEFQLLEGMLIASGNNLAQVLADHDGGTTAFVAKMNAEARRLGMTATTYTDPSGYDARTVSNASDQVKLAEAAMADPVLAAVVGEPTAVLPVAGTIHNTDRLLGADGFIGVKTGSDSAAGGNFVFADRRRIDGRSVTVFGAVLAQDVGDTDTGNELVTVEAAARKLADSAFVGLGVRTVVPAGTVVVTVSDVEHRSVTAISRAALTFFGWGGETFHPAVTLVPLAKSVSAGETVGTVALGTASGGPGPGDPSGGVASSAVVTTGGLAPVSFDWRIHHAL